MMHQGMDGPHLLWMLLMLVVVVVPFWRICVKAGYSGLWSLLAVVPLANLVFLYVLAFSDWPSLRTPPTAGK